MILVEHCGRGSSRGFAWRWCGGSVKLAAEIQAGWKFQKQFALGGMNFWKAS